MNELARHIEILLLDNDCVIMPGFGGFVGHYQTASFDKETKRFIPPCRLLGFNPQLQMNDSLLAQAYIEAYDISYPEAMRRIEAEVEEIKQSIEINGSYALRGIGTVSKTPDGRYDFEPCASGLVTPRLYGLCPYSIDEANTAVSDNEHDIIATTTAEDYAATDATESTDAHAATAPIAEAEQNAGTETKAEEDIDDEYDEDYSGFFTLKRLWYTAAAVLVCLLLPFAYSSMPTGKGSDKIQSSILDTGNVREMGQRAANAVKGIVESNKQETAQERPQKAKAEATVSTETEQQEIKAEEPKSFYTIVMASRVSKAGAEQFIDILKHAGYEEGEVYEHKGMRRVVYGRYATAGEARKSLRSLRNKSNRFDSTWVQKMN